MTCIMQILTITTIFTNGQVTSVQNDTKQSIVPIQKEYQNTSLKTQFDMNGIKIKETSRATQVKCGSGEYIAETASFIKA